MIMEKEVLNLKGRREGNPQKAQGISKSENDVDIVLIHEILKMFYNSN